MLTEPQALKILLLASQYGQSCSTAAFAESRADFEALSKYVMDLAAVPRTYTEETLPWIKEYRNRTDSTLSEANDAWYRGDPMPKKQQA